MASRKASDFLNGVPELLALRLLAQRPMHGYELVQQMALATGGHLGFGEGCVYPVLHRLEAEGVLASEREPVGGRTRVVYRLTPAGRKKLAGAVAEWRRVAAAIAHGAGRGGQGDGVPGLA